MRRIRRVFCLLSVGLIVFSVTACNSAEVNGARLTGSTFSLFGRQNNSFDTYTNGFLSGDGENRQIDTGYMQNIGNQGDNSQEDINEKLWELFENSGDSDHRLQGLVAPPPVTDPMYDRYIDLLTRQEAYMDLYGGIETFCNLMNEKYLDPNAFRSSDYEQIIAGENLVTKADVMKNVFQFVEDFNNLAECIETVYSDERISGYVVLSREQKEAMSDEEFAEWLSYAKVGALSNEARVETMKMLLDLNMEYSANSYPKLSDIGIDKLDIEYGYYVVIPEELEAALLSDSNAAYNLLNQSIIPGLIHWAEESMREISAYAGKSDDSAMGKTIVNLKNELGIQD